MALEIPGYRIIRKINQGGMATVYLAIQLSVGRQVALKVMSPVLNADPVFSQRFQREANIVGQLSHPNIISIYDIGRYKGLNYIAMDYLAGGSLQEKMAQEIGFNETLTIIDTMALALDSAHSKGYIHRDIKPENILFREDGSAVLTDFGVAKALSHGSQMTSAGKIIGTPHYMSPEQARGKPLDGRSDLYSLGVVLYEILTGSVPFQADEAVAIAVKHITLPVPKLPPQHARLQPLLDQLLAKDPEDRLQRGLEVSQAIARLRGDGQSAFIHDPTRFQPTAVQVVVLLRVLLVAGCIRGWDRIKGLIHRRSALAASTVTDGRILTAQSDCPTLISPSPETGAPVGPHRWLALPLVALVLWLAFSLSQHYLQGPWTEYIPAAVSSAAQTSKDLIYRLLVSPATYTQNESRPMPATVVSTEEKPAVQTTDPPPSETPQVAPERYGLTVAALPQSARIRILNIVEKYQPGIELTPGRYHIEVTESGFEPHIEWVTLESEAITHAVTLTEKPQPGSIFQDSISDDWRGPTMIVVPEGSYLTTGDTPSSRTRKVSFNKPFAVSQYEITFADFGKFAEANNRPLPSDNRWGKGSRPVINVSWSDAKAYADWLSAETGEPYRLPRNREWEYVARGGTESDYYWQASSKATPGSDSHKKSHANCRRGCNSPFSNLFRTKTAPVGSFAPNPFYLFDTAGNVAEWVEDCYLPTAGSDKGTPDCLERTVRGGSIKQSIEALKVHLREKRQAQAGYPDVGFRIVKELY